MRPVAELIPLARFPGVLRATRYVVRCHSTGAVTPPLRGGDTDGQQPGDDDGTSPLLSVSLPVRGYDILTAFPLAAFETRTLGRVYVASLGLLGKMTGCAATLGSPSLHMEPGWRLVVVSRLKALGVLGESRTLLRGS